jgi:hypothetical protein
VLKKVRTVEVKAICDIDMPKARALADRFGVKDAFDDIEELLGYEALDAVVICSPTHLHEAHIQAALSAKLHVLVEKPLAMSATSAQRILRAVEKHNRVVMVGMNHRYRPDVQIVRSFVQSGELGTIEATNLVEVVLQAAYVRFPDDDERSAVPQAHHVRAVPQPLVHHWHDPHGRASCSNNPLKGCLKSGNLSSVCLNSLVD